MDSHLSIAALALTNQWRKPLPWAVHFIHFYQHKMHVFHFDILDRIFESSQNRQHSDIPAGLPFATLPGNDE